MRAGEVLLDAPSVPKAIGEEYDPSHSRDYRLAFFGDPHTPANVPAKGTTTSVEV